MTTADSTSLVIDIGKTNIKIHVLDNSHNNLAIFNKKNDVWQRSTHMFGAKCSLYKAT